MNISFQLNYQRARFVICTPPSCFTLQMAYYTSYASRGYLSPEVQLKELKRRLATGMDIESAAALHPVFVGGPVELAGAMGMEPTSARTLAAAAAASATAAVP